MLAALAGFEITAKEAKHPTESIITEWPDRLRKAAFDLLTGDKNIGGTEAAVFREREFDSTDREVAREKMKYWKENGFWEGSSVGGVGARAAGTFQLAIAILLERPIAVIGKTKDADNKPVYQEAVLIYGLPDTERTYEKVPFNDLMETLTDNPIAYSVIEWNGFNHYSAWVLNEQAHEAAKNDPMDEDKRD